MSEPNEKVQAVSLTADKLMQELAGLPGDIIIMALIETAVRVMKVLKKCGNREAVESLIAALTQIRDSENG